MTQAPPTKHAGAAAAAVDAQSVGTGAHLEKMQTVVCRKIKARVCNHVHQPYLN